MCLFHVCAVFKTGHLCFCIEHENWRKLSTFFFNVSALFVCVNLCVLMPCLTVSGMNVHFVHALVGMLNGS